MEFKTEYECFNNFTLKGGFMKKGILTGLVLLVGVFLLMAANTVGVRDGNSVVTPINQDQSARLIAGWGTWVEGRAASETADFVVATYPRFANAISSSLVPKCNGFINNSGSVITLKFVTANNDTFFAYHLPAYGYSGLMPDIKFIFHNAALDSIYYGIRW
jgi:hypothetical protein